ncbi:hypothetical protein LTR46_010204 [Exophiala xenobiotica]|nr:hypothetical protein LTR46_010204 [Exophiala xenobiotica]
MAEQANIYPMWNEFETTISRSFAISPITQSNSSPVITLIVGESKTTYFVNKDVLTEAGRFFEKCLNSGMKEAQTHVIELPEDNCQAFDVFVDYAYGRKLEIVGDKDVFDCMQAWMLGDKLLAPKFQNILVASIINYYQGANRLLHPSLFAWASENVPLDSKLYRATRDVLIWTWTGCWGTFDLASHLYQEAFADLLADHKDAVGDLLRGTWDLLSAGTDRSDFVRPGEYRVEETD